MAKLKIRKGDKVVVHHRQDKGKSGEVLKMLPDENRAVVQGVMWCARIRGRRPAQEGGIIAKEAPIHVSNLALRDPRTASRRGSATSF